MYFTAMPICQMSETELYKTLCFENQISKTWITVASDKMVVKQSLDFIQYQDVQKCDE